ncbi:S9 family peptidase [Wukongibacter baidiensis]|uniref:alpha/beta hydrolase family protein n=1 Tax=Wukongibacter baidiensis TaxID=1723361 RepID=UPI003D7FFE8B
MKKRIEIKAFLSNLVLTNLKVNSEETYGLFFSNKPNIENDDYEKKLYKVDLNTFKIKSIDFDWIPDDFFICHEMVLFKKVNTGKTCLYEYDLENNSAKLITTIPFEVKDLYIIDESLYFTSELSNFPRDLYIDGKDNAKTPKYRNKVSSRATYLFKVDLENGQLVLLSDLNLDIGQVHFDLDNKRIIYSAFEVQKIQPLTCDVYTYEINSQSTIKWTNGHYRISYVGSISKDHMIFMGVDLRTNSRNDNQDHYVINRASKTFHLLTKYKDLSNDGLGVMTDSRYSTSSPVYVRDGVFYDVTVDRFKESLRGIDVKGNQLLFDYNLKTIDSFVPIEKGILFIGLNGLNLHELYFYNDARLSKISSFNDWLMDHETSKPIYIDGSIDGWVIPPLDYEAGKKYPGILMIHGGPKSIYTDAFAHDMQLLASNGYYVFYCNPRGSDGRGNDFSNIRGTFGDYAFKDLMDFVDRVLEKYPAIDSERLGVTGGSYGGYMTNYIITETNRFKAAVSERGISHMMTAFLSSDIGFEYAFEYMGNHDTPWTNQNLYLEASPLTNAHKVKTPTLFCHGLNDVRCHYTESWNMYNALLYHGIQAKIMLYEKEAHGFVVTGKPSNRLSRYTELLEWFDRFLKEEQSDGLN